MTAPLAALHGIGKRFGELWAVRDVELELLPGRIHAVLGENGAGKTTLMSILAGLYRPDIGRLEVDGQPCELRSPRQATAVGIGMVHQHFMLVPTLSVAENVMLGAAGTPWLLRPAALRRRVSEAATKLGLRVDPGALAGALSVGEQQRVEVLRVLSRGARVLILDEPTAVLAPDEVQSLFASLRRLAAEGCAIVLISHKLEELRQVADQLSIMRAGRMVAQFDDPGARSAEELAAAMVGREVSLKIERAASRPPGPLRLQARGLRVGSERGLEAVRGVDLALHSGEIFGLCGVSGNGQRELLEALAGLRPLQGGELTLAGEPVSAASPRRRTELGLRYVPEDRYRTGSAPGLSVRENLLLRRYRRPPLHRRLLLDLRAEDALCRQQLESFKITASLDQAAGLLSGGNLQKLILARELASEEAAVLLCMHPTRGLDAWATAEVRRLLLEARTRGCAVLLCSEDLDEVLALSDRLAVMFSGRFVHESIAAQADRVSIGKLILGEVPA